jgi:hypothetical protein
MDGRFFIDGENAYARYEVIVAEGGYGKLVSFPPLKKVASNDWHEDNGVEVDLSNPTLDAAEFSVKFYALDFPLADNFIFHLTDGAYHDFLFPEIGRAYRLRLVSQQGVKALGGIGEFTLQLANDFPMEGYRYEKPRADVPAPETGYLIDGVDLSAYGVTVLRGSLAEVVKSPAVKKNLLVSVDGERGAVYDSEAVTLQAKDVTLKCLMRAKTLGALWKNYDALLYNLVRPGERSLHVKYDGYEYEYPCYYSSASVEKFMPDGYIWLEFSLTLTFTAFTLIAQELLATEDGAMVTTEDRVGYFIDVRSGFSYLSCTAISDESGKFVVNTEDDMLVEISQV